MGSHFFDRFTGRLGRNGSGHGRRHGGGYSDGASSRSADAWPVEARQMPTRVLVCPRCWADNKLDARFCSACGNGFGPLEAACSGCGSMNAADAKFCSSCGKATA